MSDPRELAQLAVSLRLDVLRMVQTAGSGHVDSSFSVIEILVALYFSVMRVRPREPQWPERDRLVLSKGHAAPALYAALARRGFFPVEELATLRRLDSHLQGHPTLATPGIDAPTGSLGQGLSLACGLALGQRRLGASPSPRVFAILSDGELNEGQTWEAIMFASHQRLESLTAIVDANGLQYTGRTADVLALPDLGARARAFGWRAIETDGHDFGELLSCLASPPDGRPTMIIAHTVKGRGVPFLEDDVVRHGKLLSDSEAAHAQRHLEQAGMVLEDA